MEVGFIIFIVVALIVHNRIRSAVMQIRREEMTREIIRAVEQKRKIDKLYGRDEDV